jgi:hypothetical protein
MPRILIRPVIGPRIGAQDRPVVAQPAAHVERPHAVGAHVAQGHGRPGLRSRCAHAGEDIRVSSATASSGRCALLRDTVPGQLQATLQNVDRDLKAIRQGAQAFI